MSFISLAFVVFFIIVLLIMVIFQSKMANKLISNTQYLRQTVLLIASYIFYGYWDWRFCFLLFSVTLVAYLTAKYCDIKVVFALGIVSPLVALGVFKYFNFFIESVESVIGKDIGSLNIILPVGISFYTFQALSYVIDVRRGLIGKENNFVRLALYISFFPQLVAGPIVKAHDFLPQLYEERHVTKSGIESGMQIFAFGLFKKVVIADWLSVFVDDVFNAPAAFNWMTLLFAVVAYSIQIYFDFSGYSDMAIGCAKCLGYEFKKNFNVPYLSKNVSEFWHRWHISLSEWLRDYLYFPLGGSYCSSTRRYMNLMVTMILGGLWHGASWTFVAWGTLHGAALCMDKFLFEKKRLQGTVQVRGKISGVLVQWVAVSGTYIFVCFCWIFFRAESFDCAIQIIRGILTLQSGVSQPFVWTFIAIVLLIGAYIAIYFNHRSECKGDLNDNSEILINGFYPVLDLNKMRNQIIFFVFIGIILGLGYTGNNPFVYFQF